MKEKKVERPSGVVLVVCWNSLWQGPWHFRNTLKAVDQLQHTGPANQ